LLELIERRKKFIENESSSVGEDGEEIKTNNTKQPGPKWEWDDTIKQAPEGFPNQNTKDFVEEVKKEPSTPAAGVSPPKEKVLNKKKVGQKIRRNPRKKKKENKKTCPREIDGAFKCNLSYPRQIS